MGCSVTFHDRIGSDRFATAVDPMDADVAMGLLESAVCETVRLAFGEDAEVELTICGDAEMERLNFDHMGERGPTDVLSFPLHEWSLNGSQSHLTDDDGVSPPGPLFLGDVVVDLDQALRQSADGDWGVTEELVLLTIHGTLHLLGHDHADIDEEERMRRLEHDVLGGAASAPPRDRLAAGFLVRSLRPRGHDWELSNPSSVPGQSAWPTDRQAMTKPRCGRTVCQGGWPGGRFAVSPLVGLAPNRRRRPPAVVWLSGLARVREMAGGPIRGSSARPTVPSSLSGCDRQRLRLRDLNRAAAGAALRRKDPGDQQSAELTRAAMAIG